MTVNYECNRYLENYPSFPRADAFEKCQLSAIMILSSCCPCNTNIGKCSDIGAIISTGERKPSPFSLLNLIHRWLKMQLSCKGDLKESSSCLFSSHQNDKKCVYGSDVKIWDFSVKIDFLEFFSHLHLLAPWKPNSCRVWMSVCRWCKKCSSCKCEGLFLLLVQQRLPGLWWFSSQRKCDQNQQVFAVPESFLLIFFFLSTSILYLIGCKLNCFSQEIPKLPPVSDATLL